MKFNKSSTIVLALVAAIALATSASLALSIESEPVKVTHRNSGPRYDIDEDLERAKLTPVSEQQQQQQQPPVANNGARSQEEDGAPSSSDQESTIPMGHVAIRRIFLVPMMRPPRPDWQEAGADGEHPSLVGPRPAPDSDVMGQQPSMFAKPFWPFLTPARPAHSHHMFGADEASRSPSSIRPSGDQDRAASGAEREDDQAPLRPTMFDPIQMMVDMMHQAINSQLMTPTPNLTTDLNKEASSSKNGDESPDRQGEERPQMPGSGGSGGFQLSSNNNVPMKPGNQNETREDIVEIEGKKYLRKTVINRHVGENIIFMTKRLIFVPLNETESASNEKPAIPTTTTVSSLSADKTDAPTTTVTSGSIEETTTKAALEPSSSEAPLDDKKSTDSKPVEEIAATTPAATAATTTTTTPSGPTEAASEPTTTTTTTAAASPEQPTAASTAESVETTAKAKSSWVERVTDAVDKAAERLVEGVRSESAASTSTEKPSSSSS